jgi:intracellular sulfur oxidation DsrE/DsrF family protein
VPRIRIGCADCHQPYNASILNISALSFGAISKNALLALNRGAKTGGFANNTGEGGISSYHLEAGGDLIWQIGTGYLRCRTPDGDFGASRFREPARRESLRMIELMLSQGAKPGYSGVLPGVKVSREIAAIRGTRAGETLVSPPGHRVFSTPIGLLEFVAKLRHLANGKPVGFKLYIGRRSEFFAICNATLETKITPDFIVVDGGEGGTGADLCASARGMMLALGCIQSLRCNTNHCPTGVTTQKPSLVYGLDVTDKADRVYRYHRETVRGALELLGAMGMYRLDEIRPHHIFRRIDDLQVRYFGELCDFLEPGQLIDNKNVPEGMRGEWNMSRPDRWTQQAEQGQYAGESTREEKNRSVRPVGRSAEICLYNKEVCTRMGRRSSMRHRLRNLAIWVLPLFWVISSQAGESLPWGKASPRHIEYRPQKVVYDVAVPDIHSFSGVLDRVSYLNNLYYADPFDASIVLVLHGDEIPFFAINRYATYRELMQRAQSLTVAGPVEFRMCRVAARAHGLEPDEIHGFVQVVPMADAEIVRLQQEEGYVYMR